MDLMDVAGTGLGVLVGVDGSTASHHAAGQAAAEARLRHAPLTVCHVHAPAQDGPDSPAGAGCVDSGTGDPVLDGVESRLADHPGEPLVRPFATAGHPAEVLAALAADADLTVVGSRGLGGVAGLMLGSVSLHLATRAPGPVLVIRPGRRPGAVAPFGGHVVAGVDGSPGSGAALRFGFAEADRRGCPLAAVHVRRGDPADTYVDDRTLEMHAERRDSGRDLLDAAVDPWAARYPRVPVKRALHHGSPAAGLLRAAAGAVLVAVGRTGRGAVAGMVFGSVSQAVLHRARCPVAVVPVAHDGSG